MSSRSYWLNSSWFERGHPRRRNGVIYDDPYLVREKRTNRLIATIGNRSMSTSGFASTRSWVCLYLYHHADLYRSLINNKPNGDR